MPFVAVSPVTGSDSAGSPCARHAENAAVAACQRCGQFICALCKTDMDGRAYCPSCFERLVSEGAFTSTANRVWNYAGMAGLCLVAPIFCYVVGPLFSIAGVTISIVGLVDKRRRGESEGIIRLAVLGFLNLLWLAGAVLLVAALFGAFGRV